MRDSWQMARLGDVADVRWGDTNTTKKSYTSSGFRAFSASGPDGFLPHADYHESGVVLSAIGANCGKSWLATGEWSCIKNTIRILGFGAEADVEFLYWALSNPSIWPIRGSAQPFIAQTDARNVQVALPPLEEQLRIAGVLGALDDLIETNRRLADSSTALWRVLLDEALTNADGSTPLSSIADFVNGKNFTEGASGTGRPVIRTPEVRRGPVDGTVYSDVEATDDFVAHLGDTLFVWSGSLMVGRWLWEDGLINQHIFKVKPRVGIPPWLVLGLIERQMPQFLRFAADKATTMGHIKRAQLDADVPFLSQDEVARLTKVIEPLWNQALSATVEAQEIARTRDELLPLLLSGAIRVDEVAA